MSSEKRALTIMTSIAALEDLLKKFPKNETAIIELLKRHTGIDYADIFLMPDSSEPTEIMEKVREYLVTLVSTNKDAVFAKATKVAELLSDLEVKVHGVHSFYRKLGIIYRLSTSTPPIWVIHSKVPEGVVRREATSNSLEFNVDIFKEVYLKFYFKIKQWGYLSQSEPPQE